MKALFCGLLLVLSCTGIVSVARAETFQPNYSLELAQKSGISMQRATAIVRRATGGRVVSASPTKNGGFKVRVVLEGGRVKTVKVDRNGNIR